MKIFRFNIAVSFLCLAAAAAFGQSSASEAGLTANPVFEKNCAKCHGKTAEGRHFGGPALATEKTTSMSVEDLRNIINNGKGRMPKYEGKLTAEEVDTLVLQIKALKSK